MTRRSQIVLMLVAAIVVLGGAAVGLGLLAQDRFGPPIIDEWACVDGEAPAERTNGAVACFPEDAELPKGWTWDPLGNRPFSCRHRSGWTSIVDPATQQTDCLRDGLDVPEGWEINED